MQHETHTHEDENVLEHAHHTAHTSEKIPGQKIKNNTALSTQAAILIAGAVIGISVLAHGFIAKGNSSSSGTAYLETFAGKNPGIDEFIEGDKKAKVYFVEYSDTECPFCISFHNTVSAIREKYGNKITFIYRHFPLTNIHPDALPEAIKMTCVGKLKGDKAYYDFMTKLFDYKLAKQVSAISPEFVSGFLKDNAISESDFTKCVQDPATKAIVEASTQDGSTAGVNGTPTSFILVKDGEEYKVIKRLEGAAQQSFITPLLERAIKS